MPSLELGGLGWPTCFSASCGLEGAAYCLSDLGKVGFSPVLVVVPFTILDCYYCMMLYPACAKEDWLDKLFFSTILKLILAN